MMQTSITHCCVIQQLRNSASVWVYQLCGNYRNLLQLSMQGGMGVTLLLCYLRVLMEKSLYEEASLFSSIYSKFLSPDN